MAEPPLSRRRFLGALGGGLAAGAGAGARLPPAPRTPATDGATVGEVDPDRTPIPEAETPFAVYQYRSATRGPGFVPTLPINVVFPLESAGFGDVVDVFRDARWYPRPAEYPRFAYDRETDAWARSHWSGAETSFGAAGRLHVRCWRLADTASVQVHVDTPPSPHHRIRSFANGRAAVEDLFGRAGWTVDDDRLRFDNDQPPDHDGAVSVIRR